VGLSSVSGQALLNSACGISDGIYAFSDVLNTGGANGNLLKFPTDIQELFGFAERPVRNRHGSRFEGRVARCPDFSARHGFQLCRDRFAGSHSMVAD